MRRHLWLAFPMLLLLTSRSDGQEKKTLPDLVRTRGAWEYKTLLKSQITELGKTDLGAGLNALGDEGWELVAVDRPEKGTATYIFKRVKARPMLFRPDKDDPKKAPRGAVTFTFVLKHARAADVQRVIQMALGKKDELRIAVDERTNTVFLTGAEETIAEVRELIARLDVPIGKEK
jgi:Bacterial type II/III secretion system short domain